MPNAHRISDQLRSRENQPEHEFVTDSPEFCIVPATLTAGVTREA